MVKPAKDRRQALYEAYLEVPDHQRAEIINGTLYVSPRPSPRHANATSVLGGGPGGWWIIDEPELQLVSLEPLVPDLAGWRVERMPALPETAFFTLAPDWVCEVLSRSTESRDRQQKPPIYARHRIAHVWLIDPQARTLEVYVLDEDGRWREVRTYEGDTRVRAEPFAAIEIDLGALWAAPSGS